MYLYSMYFADRQGYCSEDTAFIEIMVMIHRKISIHCVANVIFIFVTIYIIWLCYYFTNNMKFSILSAIALAISHATIVT